MFFRRMSIAAIALCMSCAITACGPDDTASDNNDENNTSANNTSANNTSTNNTSTNNTSTNNTSTNNTSTNNTSTNNTSTNNTSTNNTSTNNTSTNNTSTNNTSTNNTSTNNTSTNNTSTNNTSTNNTSTNNTSTNNTSTNNNTPAICGNGVVEGDEICDGADCPSSPLDCDDFNECTADVIEGSAATCDAVCTNTEITACDMGTSDGCCPAGCTANNDADCDPGNQGSPATGDACATDADCRQNDLCITEAQGFTGGYCSTLCQTDADCAGDGICLPVDEMGTQLCLDVCQQATDCRTGYDCTDPGTGTSLCLPMQQPPMGETGIACTSDADCASAEGEFCILETQGWSGGYCSRGCQADTDCPMGSSCNFVDPNDPSQGAVCIDDCTMDTDCRTGYECFDNWGNNKTGCFPVASGMGAVGDACTGLQDCGGGQDGFCIGEDQGFTGGYCSISGCVADTDCGTGAHCGFKDPATGEGVCLDDCAMDADCRTGYVCDDGDMDMVNECFPGSNGTGLPGNACTDVSDCAGGINAFCISEMQNPDFTGGYCAQTNCATDMDCPMGSHCGFIDPQAGTGFCLADCTMDADCRAGYACGDGDADMVNECFPGGTGTGAVGDTCMSVQDCAGGVGAQCFQTVDAGGGQQLIFPGGYCTDSCATDADCGAGGHCAFVQQGQGICFSDCTTDADCRTSYSCIQADQAGGSECFPPL